MRVVQIAPEIAPGSGVGGVAYALEQAWRRRGVETGRFTMDDAAGAWLPRPEGGVRGKVVLAVRVVWFTTVGTWRARAASRRDGRGSVVVTHNDVLFGDVYVNHGILSEAMRARGGYAWRMVRNPLHLFTAARDRLRYTTRVHDVVTSLTRAEEATLRRTYGRVRPRTVVIPNGVDTQRFRPAGERERQDARDALGIPADALVALFVGHEFGRKGLRFLVAAARSRADVHVAVVGGSPEMLAELRREAAELTSSGRLHLAGTVDDPTPWFRAADLLALPSAYEANALVVLEALACGLPVVATPVGYVPDIVVDGENGFVVASDAGSVGDALDRYGAQTEAGRARLSAAARATAEAHDWDVVAARYLDLFDEILRGRHGEEAR
ncbi:glycosyltransferase family 4 protein [Cellulosimicrobium sp. PMB13]|uniref:glycosyltransferase family 4 protein n=1 Tax=Cellulosimicrobium sp. PMB13 TaxID=3120158 RepID=UPI003F4B86E0